MSRPPASDLVAACAVRTLARTDTFMPMKPAAPERIAPIAKPIATVQESRSPRMMKTTTPTPAMVVYCRLQIGLRAFADRARDLLHALGAGVRRHDAPDRVDAVDDRQQSTQNDQSQ